MFLDGRDAETHRASTAASEQTEQLHGKCPQGSSPTWFIDKEQNKWEENIRYLKETTFDEYVTMTIILPLEKSSCIDYIS